MRIIKDLIGRYMPKAADRKPLTLEEYHMKLREMHLRILNRMDARQTAAGHITFAPISRPSLSNRRTIERQSLRRRGRNIGPRPLTHKPRIFWARSR